MLGDAEMPKCVRQGQLVASPLGELARLVKCWHRSVIVVPYELMEDPDPEQCLSSAAAIVQGLVEFCGAVEQRQFLRIFLAVPEESAVREASTR